MKVYVALCEGPHDIALIGKILKVYGFALVDGTVSTFPHPMNRMTKKSIEAAAVSTKHIEQGISSYKIPRAVYHCGEDCYVFLHSMGGDSHQTESKELIGIYEDFYQSFAFGNPDHIESFAYTIFYDADSIGVDGRVQQIRETFGDLCVEQGARIASGSMLVPMMASHSSLGCYVFHDPDDSQQRGSLEDLLLHMMRRNNETIFRRAEEYLQAGRSALLGADSESETVRDKEYDPSNGKYKGGHKYHEKKSLIAAAGQLQFSGMQNAVTILKSDYITREDILENEECDKIAGLFGIASKNFRSSP